MYPSFIFIRHGLAKSNQKQKMVERSGKDKNQIKAELQAQKYNRQFFDNQLTQTGKNEASFASKKLKMNHIDIVVVSPLRRSLQTCDIIFGKLEGVKVYVQPLMSEKLTRSPNIGNRIKQSKQIYGKKFDFSKIPESLQQTWYVDFILPEQKAKYVKEIIQKDNLSCAQATIKLLQNGQGQTSIQLNERVKKLKQQLIRYKSISKKKVALVGHSAVFKALTATGSYQNGQLINQCQFNHGQPKQIPIVIDDYFQEDEDLTPFCKFPIFKE